MSAGYETVTETPGIGASREQLSMLQTRYRLAAALARGGSVLEVACGSGIGVGLLASEAHRTVAGDIDPALIAYARRQYDGRKRVALLQLDAHRLPFDDETFDVVLLFEAIYYLRDAVAFAVESRRVLRPGGKLVICTVNPEWTDFNPSPFSTRYWSAAELNELLANAGLRPQILGAFSSGTSKSTAITGTIKRAAVRLHLMPKTMRGKQLLKRIFMGKLLPLPKELDSETGAYVKPTPLAAGNHAATKVLYAIGTA